MNRKMVMTLLLMALGCCGVQTQGKTPLTFTVEGVAFNMVFVEGGEFMMGATKEQRDKAGQDELPVHPVTLRNYYIGETEVTQELWVAVMGYNPSYFEGTNLPVERVSWQDAQKFVKKLSRLTNRNFRLPTEAEWEYAARGGNRSLGHVYSGGDNLDEVAWYDDNGGDRTHRVGEKHANELGLFDMSGNVREWCSDWYDPYSGKDQRNPEGPKEGTERVLRGGGWSSMTDFLRVSFRNSFNPPRPATVSVCAWRCRIEMPSGAEDWSTVGPDQGCLKNVRWEAAVI